MLDDDLVPAPGDVLGALRRERRGFPAQGCSEELVGLPSAFRQAVRAASASDGGDPGRMGGGAYVGGGAAAGRHAEPDVGLAALAAGEFHLGVDQ